MLSIREFVRLIKACRSLPDGPDCRCDDYVLNLMFTSLDFRARVEMVNKALAHFEAKHGRGRDHLWLTDLFSRVPATKAGHRKLAHTLWGNAHWTRAEFLRVLVSEFEKRGIRDQKTLSRWLRRADFEKDVKGKFRAVRPGGHSVGLAIFRWLQMRCGVQAIKPDVHVLRFVEAAVGRPVTALEASEELKIVAKHIGRTARRLDAAIWDQQREGPSATTVGGTRMGQTGKIVASRGGI